MDSQITCLVETWLLPVEEISVFGYVVFRVDRRTSRNSRNYGGIIVLVKQHEFSSLSRLPSMSENLIWLRLNFLGKWFILGCVYISPENSSYCEEDTWAILEEEIILIRSRYKGDSVLLIGDLNAYTAEQPELNMNFVSDDEDDPVAGIIPSVYFIP